MRQDAGNKLQLAETGVHHILHFFLGQGLVEEVHIVVFTGEGADVVPPHAVPAAQLQAVAILDLIQEQHKVGGGGAQHGLDEQFAVQVDGHAVLGLGDGDMLPFAGLQFRLRFGAHIHGIRPDTGIRGLAGVAVGVDGDFQGVRGGNVAFGTAVHDVEGIQGGDAGFGVSGLYPEGDGDAFRPVGGGEQVGGQLGVAGALGAAFQLQHLAAGFIGGQLTGGENEAFVRFKAEGRNGLGAFRKRGCSKGGQQNQAEYERQSFFHGDSSLKIYSERQIPPASESDYWMA